MTRMWQVCSLRGHLPAKGRFEVACGRFTWHVEGEGRFDVACIAFPFRLGGGGSDVMCCLPLQIIRWGRQ